MVELGYIDIATEVSMLSSYLALLHEGHLEATLHVMEYLWLKHNTRLIFNPTYPDIVASDFTRHDWMELYGDVHKAIPPNMLKPLGKEVKLRMICHSNHAGCKQTHRTWTGILIYCNLVLIIWVSNWQLTIKTSVFGAEFVAMKHGIKALRVLHYKLCMMGVPLSGSLYIYGDNKSQVTNLSRPELTLKKKSHSICYHAIWDSVAMGESLSTHCKTNDNLSDPLTLLTIGAKCRRLMSNILCDICDDHPKQ
jgi:hypothetical protein